ncbi:MAG: ATP synthase F0 subunit C [Acidobacteriota bacterium]|nr:ATP synthase F0 subunit C [Blastocatellia bacterium]MDW8412388.1 ATP synthase F0 subunit C [Acidobacteriota bacterium]
MNKLKLLSTLFTLLTFVSTAAAQGTEKRDIALKGIGALAVAIAAAFAALGDGRAIAAACESTARNPGAGGRIQVLMILGLALIETLVLFTFLAAYLGL